MNSKKLLTYMRNRSGGKDGDDQIGIHQIDLREPDKMYKKQNTIKSQNPQTKELTYMEGHSAQ